MLNNEESSQSDEGNGGMRSSGNSAFMLIILKTIAAMFGLFKPMIKLIFSFESMSREDCTNISQWN